MDTDTPDLKRIYVSPTPPPVPPPGFQLDTSLPPVPPPPSGFVPDGPGAYTGPDATPKEEDVETDEKGSPYRDARAPEVPSPPPGFVADLPDANDIKLDVISRYLGHLAEGFKNMVKKPGQAMTPNPHPEGSEEWYDYERQRAEGIAQAAPEIALGTLPAAPLIGAPAK